MKFSSLLLALLSCMASTEAQQGNAKPFYTNNKDIVELNPSNFDDVVLNTNHSSVVEFYAPWCRYCLEFERQFEKAAKVASDYAHFGAVNCDNEKNRPLCSKYRVEGFPTVMVFRPPKILLDKPETVKKSHSSEVYKGERKTKPLVQFLQGRIKNYVRRLNNGKLDKFLDVKEGDKNRILLLTNKNSLSPTYKSLGIDYLQNLELAYLYVSNDNKETIASKIEALGPDFEAPSLVAITPEGVEIFTGSMKSKSELSEFLSKFGEPNEGEHSVTGLALEGVKSGKYKNFKQYFKKQSKQAAKSAPVKDEL